MTAAQFRAWLDAMHVQRKCLQKDCADALGVQPRQITRWKEYDSPKYIGLACAAIYEDLPPWTKRKRTALFK